MPTMGLNDGQWFDVADAQQWHGPGGMLYLVGSKWALHDHASAMIGDPAKPIDARQALSWITCAGYDIPEQLVAVAESSRLR